MIFTLMLWNSFFAFHNSISEVKVLFAQSCQNLWDPLDCSSPGSSVHGIFQAKMLEWIVIFFSRRSSWPRDLTPVSCITGGFFTIFAVELHGSVVKKPAISVGDIRDISLTPGSGRSPGGGNGNLLQYFCLGNPMDIGACLVGYRRCGLKESGRTKHKHAHCWTKFTVEQRKRFK